MKTEIIQKLIEHVTSECKPIDQERQFDDMLDECYSFEKVGGIFETMSPSRVLKEVDPTAYRCGMNDYFSNGEHYEIGNDIYETQEIDKARESFADDLDSEIKDLESEIEDAEADEDFDISELAQMKRKLEELNSDLKEVDAYIF